MTSATHDRIRQLRFSGVRPSSIADRLGLSTAEVIRALDADLTALNIRTTQRYRRCQSRGGCVPSGEIVSRSFPMGLVELPLCKRCRVPMRGKGRAARVSWRERGRGAE